MLLSTEKYAFQSQNPGIWAMPIPGLGIKKNVRDPGIPNLGIPGLQSLHASESRTATSRHQTICQAANLTFESA